MLRTANLAKFTLILNVNFNRFYLKFRANLYARFFKLKFNTNLIWKFGYKLPKFSVCKSTLLMLVRLRRCACVDVIDVAKTPCLSRLL